MLKTMFEFSNVFTAVWHRETALTMHFIFCKVSTVHTTIVGENELSLAVLLSVLELTRILVTSFIQERARTVILPISIELAFVHL